MSAIRLLIKPTLFTAGVCTTCFCGTAIYQYENKRRSFSTGYDWISAQRYKTNFNQKYSTLRQNINEWKNRLSTGEKVACGAIFINCLVFCAWRIKGLRPVMTKYFISTPSSSKISLSPMILSLFSHTTVIHLGFNMCALYSFSTIAASLLGPEQMIGLYLSAGTVSSLASLAYGLATKRVIGSLGASGALLGVVAYVCIARPDSKLFLLFIPIAAGNAIKCLMLVDFVGAIARWKYIDHAAHLGGSIFGVWYATKGEKLFFRYRKEVVDRWIELKR